VLRGVHEAPLAVDPPSDGLVVALEDGLLPPDGPALGSKAEERAALVSTAEPATLEEPMFCDGPMPEDEPMVEDKPMVEELPVAGAAPEDEQAASASAELENKPPPLMDLAWALKDVAIEHGLTPPLPLQDEQPALAPIVEDAPLALLPKDVRVISPLVQDIPVVPLMIEDDDERIFSIVGVGPTSRLPSLEAETTRYPINSLLLRRL
jgi:hypothetical protein